MNYKILLLIPFLTTAFISKNNGWIKPEYKLYSFSRKESSYYNSFRNYPLSRNYHEIYLKRLNSRNISIQNSEILNTIPEDDEENIEADDMIYSLLKAINETNNFGYSLIVNKKLFKQISLDLNENYEKDMKEEEDLNDIESSMSNGQYFDIYGNQIRSYGNRPTNKEKNLKSENFEVIKKSPYNFTNVGGYDKIKSELYQCIDILSNYSKYKKYNVRTPKGLIFEGPPGNGKTLLAKALAGEAKLSFITVSGSEFQDKYVGVGSSRVRELFKLAKENVPCIIFIDEIDALGRQRSKDGESSGNERDSTLNELLIALDGFKEMTGVFVIGATNRIDLLDAALIRPGRIDKKIFIGNPDEKTRKEILNIHLNGKPYEKTIILDDLIEMTNGLSGAQIENLLNEAMLNAIRYNRHKITNEDLDEVINKIIGGWQSSEHNLAENMLDQIAIHELGHAVVGMVSKNHAKMTKVVINLSSPSMPGYTIFENTNNVLSTREALFEHLMILLAGRIAEEVFYDVSVTTGAINDFDEALKLAQNMICYYGMGKQLIYPNLSEKYKEIIDIEVAALINEAYGYAEFIIKNSKDLILEGAEILKRDKVLKSETLFDLMENKYNEENKKIQCKPSINKEYSFIKNVKGRPKGAPN